VPGIGEIKRAKEIGFRSNNRKFIWIACPICSKERWVPFFVKTNRPQSLNCRTCVRMGKTYALKSGRHKTNEGYIVVWIPPDSFFSSMTHNGRNYLLEHRLIMAMHLGRCLHPWEIVHHRNGIRDDNRVDNLQLVSDDRHKQITILETRIAKLKTENKLLKRQVNQLVAK